MDGVTDGVADSVESLRRACLALPADVIVDEMIRMHDEDGCTIEGDGVGEQVVQQVDTSGCVDGELTNIRTASDSPWILCFKTRRLFHFLYTWITELSLTGRRVVRVVPVDATLCGLVDAGVLNCADDFCPDCQNAHKCDASCAFDCSTAGNYTTNPRHNLISRDGYD